ncbi:MAG: hypothetical protein ACRYFK_05045 [Janthinobacterium lividum]
MTKTLTLAGLLLLVTTLVARAQVPANILSVRASTYQAEYDSLQQRAARVRTRTDTLVSRFTTHLAGLGGTSRRIRSFAPPQVLMQRVTGEASTKKVLAKRQIVKHKTHNAEVEKVFYYGASKRLLLYEYYEQHQLVHRLLHEYTLRNGRAFGAPFRTTEWVRGDYLHVTIRPRPLQLNSSKLQYYFTAPRQPS